MKTSYYNRFVQNLLEFFANSPAPRADLNDVDVDLMRAIRRGDLPEIDRAIASGANVNVQFTFLHSIAELGKRAFLYREEPEGDTPLHLAVVYRKLAAVELLVKISDDIDAVNSSGDTALHLAAKIGSEPDVIRFLIESGSNVNLVNKNGETALDLARNVGHPEAIQLLELAEAEIHTSSPTPGM